MDGMGDKGRQGSMSTDRHRDQTDSKRERDKDSRR